MSNPRFSILIPTRDRPATFRYALETAVSQAGNDYEVVVADNCSSHAVRMIADAAATRARPIVYLRSDEILPMAENWERGLRACSGDYVTILGDDDGLLPSTLHVARRLIDSTQTRLLSWGLHIYHWPDILLYWLANRLSVDFGNEVFTFDSREALRDFYAGRVPFFKLPLIYSSFVHRSIVERAYALYGAYFVPPLVAPDISSGILNLHLCEKFTYSTRPLAIRGVSGSSTGAAQLAHGRNSPRLDRYLEEERTTKAAMIHPALIPTQNLHIIIANAKLRCKEAYFPGDAELEVDREYLVRQMLSDLNGQPEDYRENLADALALAARIGMVVQEGEIPARQPPFSRKQWAGPIKQGQTVTGVLIDCDLAGVYNVADAARLAEAAMVPFDS